MKRLLLLFVLLFSINFYSQPLSMPVLWLKASWDDFSVYGLQNHLLTYRYGNSSVATLDNVNGYKALYFDNEGKKENYFSFRLDSLSNSSSVLILIAYQPFIHTFSQGIPEYGLWTFYGKDTIALTSVRYGKHSKSFLYQYRNYPGAIITSNLLSVDTEKGSLSTLLLGYADSMFFHGKLAEFIVVKDYLNNRQRQIWQSYLALKYGSTLYKSDYVDSKGDTLWRYLDNKEYSEGVGGIGRDDLLGLNQNVSTIAGDIVTVSYYNADNEYQSAKTKFSDGEYILWGHSNGEASLGQTLFPIGETSYYLFDRIWKIRRNNKRNHLINLQINSAINHKLKIFISRSSDFLSWETKVLNPSLLGEYMAKFEGLNIEDSVLYFTFGYDRTTADSLLFANNKGGDNNNSYPTTPINNIFTEVSYLPNPVKDNLYVNYKLTRRATVWFSLHNSTGTTLYRTAPELKSAGSTQKIIPMGQLIDGTYVLYIHVDNMILSRVIIKQNF